MAYVRLNQKPQPKIERNYRTLYVVDAGDSRVDRLIASHSPIRSPSEHCKSSINKHGGDVTFVELPAMGICGNTHFPMSDLNNVQIANLLSKFLADKGLD